MNSYEKSPEPEPEPEISHGDLLADCLRRLDTAQTLDQGDDHHHHHPQVPPSFAKAPYDGYGFRPPSGVSTPSVPPDRNRNSPLPDVNGLGWPGQ
jgi:hypothetical protein